MEEPPVLINTGLYPIKDVEVKNKKTENVKGEGLDLRRSRGSMYKEKVKSLVRF